MPLPPPRCILRHTVLPAKRWPNLAFSIIFAYL